ncbi:L-type lectin-domain containing receptor kinase IX.1-like [Pyrus x bretschneideri]|uniref:L-type lectin-domain containing receptor kinase IX.1-like n=1 Tax=Pyrus x bretschneideri TaxID=225117 RepID=UPI00202E1E29|nr:L-type lectin-domain containing receptor kinase IX.1-like [Pyrus x bretschneideri]
MVIPSAKLLPLLLLFLLFFPSASPLTFNYDSFTIGTTGIFLEGAAYIDEQLIKLTRSARQNKNVARATYRQPFLLWETFTGKIADFSTQFTFMIDSGHADGMVFFIAPSGSLLNIPAGGGGHLGLPVEEQPGDTTRTLYPFVAVEFDIYRNEQPVIRDPVGDHVGIDINSLKSNITTPWNGDINEGRQNDAWISYNSSSKNLSVAFTSFQNGTNGTEVKVLKYLSYIIDLRQYLPDLVIVGFSAATGQDIAVHKIVSWNFTSAALFDDDPTHNKPEPIAPSGVKPGPGKSKMGLLLGLGIAGSLILFTGKAKQLTDVMRIPFVKKLIDKELENVTGPRKFSYHELAQATSNFEEGKKLGEGGFGGVYRGFIKDLNLQVAVKRISSGSKQGMKEYASEVRIISRLRHRNLVQLIGWCHENRELLLVYEFLPNRSLDSHLFKENSLLSWQVRYNIAKGLASALLYLHEEWEQCVLHRDIKSSNVMLDTNFNVKLGDFGLARLVDHGEQSLTTIVAGTRGYMALEYVTTGRSTKESDVYSFGVVSLEIACGRKPIDFKLESSQIELVKWVWGLYEEGNVIQAADPKLYGHFDEKQMECLMIVGLWCAHPQYIFRPSIQQAIQVLNFEVPLPILPSKMPVVSSIALVSDSDTITSERGQTESSGTPHSLTITPSSTEKFVTPSTTFQSAQ